MTTGLTLQQLFSEIATDQFLVPEIQRDYVWDKLHLDALLTSLRGAWEKAQHEPALTISGADADAQVERSLKEYYRRQRHSHHLGFIYAYHDPAYPGKAFLIDGQQRLLSLYLLLLARAVKEGAQEDFRARYLLNQQAVRLDYRVREATHDFLPRFVELALRLPPAADIRQAVESQYWYFHVYAQDVTIAHVVDNYAYLVGAVEQSGPDYNYLSNFVRFWYFDTGDSARGEDLYLSLNSTGLMTSAGENQRAYLLGNDPNAKTAEQKKYWGERLERWQDFFWKNRQANPNADRGMNEFFRWVRVLGPVLADPACAEQELLLQAVQHALQRARWGVGEQTYPGFTLKNAECVIQALQFLFPKVAGVTTVQTVGLEAAWLAPSKDALSLADTFRLLPVLSYCVARQSKSGSDQWQHLQRVVRYFFNLHRLLHLSNAEEAARHTAKAIRAAYQLGLTEAGDPVDLISILEPGSVLLPAEEANKLTLYGNAGPERSKVEEMLWSLEDDPWNAGQVQHLFVLKPLVNCSLEEVALIVQRYRDLRLAEKRQSHTLQSLLLLYGNGRVQNKYSQLYTQYDYGDWERIVRNLGGVFKAFFQEFAIVNTSLDAFYRQKREAYYGNHTVPSLLADTSFENQLRVLAVVCDRLQDLSSPDQQPISPWDYGGTLGYFYEESLEPGEFIFGDETLRFWNTEDRLTSAHWRKTAVSQDVYHRFLLLASDSSYRQFVEQALIAAGAQQEVTVVPQEA